MLVPIQTAGYKAPLFFVHGAYGTMPIGPALAKACGPEQPIYAIYADGFDGRGPRSTSVANMVMSYVSQVAGVRPRGRLVVGGMCGGGLIAVEVARKLLTMQYEIGTLILLDPPPFVRKRRIDRNERGVMRQLYRQAQKEIVDQAAFYRLPIDPRDRQQLHAATLAGMTSMLAISHFYPSPFDGKAELIVSFSMAARYLHQDGAYRNYLTRPHAMHVLPGHHLGIFKRQQAEVARLIEFVLRSAFDDASDSVVAAAGFAKNPSLDSVR